MRNYRFNQIVISLLIILVISVVFILKRIENLVIRSNTNDANSLQFNYFVSKYPNNFPTLYIITPTNTRITQKADLTRMVNTLLHVNNLHWIVVEDREDLSPLVTRFLACYPIRNTHLFIPTPARYKLRTNDTHWRKPRGVLQRNLGLEWLRNNVNHSNGVVYFADDDNTYDLKLFEEMRYTRKVSVWPVGIVGYLRYESPIVRNQKVVGWFTFWKPKRSFALDMAGFAVNLELIKNSGAKFFLDAGRGELESNFLTSLKVTLNDLEPLADNCTRILVWHTQTLVPSLKNEDKLIKAGKQPSDLNIEV